MPLERLALFSRVQVPEVLRGSFIDLSEDTDDEEGIDNEIEVKIQLKIQEYGAEMEMYQYSLEDGLETGDELDDHSEHTASIAQTPSNLCGGF